MIQKKLLSLLIILSCSLGFGTTIIRNISVSGNSVIPSASILAGITLKAGDAMSTENIMADINAIYNQGNFKDSVGAETIPVSKEVVDLIFTVEENPKVEHIYFVGLSAFKPEELLVSMDSKVGSILNYNVLRNDIKTIPNFFHERGFILAEVKEVSEPQNDNVLTFVLKEGQIEDIFIKGLTFTKPYVVTREMETQIGSAFNLNTLQSDIRSIHNSGFFENINIDPPINGLLPDKVIVVLNATEKKSGSLQFGGGIGSASGFFGFLKLEFINFLGEGYNVSTQGQWGQTQTTYELKYVNPWFYKDHTSLSARLWNTNGQIDEGQGISNVTNGQGLDALSSGAEVTVGKPLTKQISVFGTLRSNEVVPASADVQSYLVRSIGGGLNYDTRDYIFNPSKGDYFQINGNLCTELLGASIDFLKYRIRYNKYFPLGDDFALGFKGTFDDASGTIFDTERYYAGGATTVRGYKDGSPFAIGGRRYLGSAELRYNINTSVQFYLFFDVGKVVQGYSGCTYYGDPSWRYGKGLGFKIQTPIGPLRFDYAWGDGRPYNEGLDSSQGVIHFNIENSF